MLIFNPETHEYFNGEKNLISVTTLLKKHGLSPDYSMVAETVLKAKAERGTLVHKEIEDYCKKGIVGFTKEIELFINYVKKNNIDILDSEKMVFNDVVAGTFDLLIMRDQEIVRVDIKTTSSVHREPCSWQLSLYDDMDPVKANKLEVWHFVDDELKIVPIPFKPNEEVKKLLDCERKGELYTQPVLTLDATDLMIIEEAEIAIAAAKKMEAKAKEIKEKLLKAMEDNSVTKFENDKFKISYVAPTEKQTIDTKALKEKYPEIAEELTKTTSQKASVRITLKEVE